MFQFSHPHWLWLLLPAWGWILWLTRTSEVQLSSFRRRLACAVRLFIVAALVLALAGVQWRRAIEGMNVFFALDRSDSVPSSQQEQALRWLNRVVQDKPESDRAGVLVFGAEAAIEATPGLAFSLPQVQAVVPTDRTDLGGAIRLATAAFPETGQRRIVLLSDGNENLDDAFNAAVSARASGVSIDVVPLGAERENRISVRRLEIPSSVAKGQTFEAKVFVEADRAGTAKLRLYRNEQFLGESALSLEAGKNLFTFPQTLAEPGFYNYDVRVDAPGDGQAQDNRGFGFAWVRGVPRVLIVSSAPEDDTPLATALKSSELDVTLTGISGFPATLAELQTYDSVFFCNVFAAVANREQFRLLESAVRDFGVGFVCVGGDEAYSAGAYRNTPLETILPVNMDLDSKKVVPPGALVLVIDKSGSMSGEKIEMVRQAAIAATQVLSDRDFVGVVAFDGATYTMADIQPAKNKAAVIQAISGLTADGGTVMYPAMERAEQMLAGVKASLKHCIVLTDGISEPGDFSGLARRMAEKRITVSTVGVGAQINGETLQEIASLGRGRFYEAPSPSMLPHIFIKETAIILKTAISEEPFTPRMVSLTEPVRGIGAGDYPSLLGYVAVEPKPRAEAPLVTEKGDPLLAHWQYGLGRTVAFTSDARNKWARNWTAWPQYQQFWRQIAQWSLRRLAKADFVAEAGIENGVGRVSVEALDARGDFQNFLNLQAVVVGPGGSRQTVTLKQNGPGYYEAQFPADTTGAYLLHVAQMENGRPVASQIIGASLAYSPELNSSGPNLPLLRRIAEVTGGSVLDPTGPASSPFHRERIKTYQAQELWEWLLRLVVIAFVLDVGVRRVQIEREELARALRQVFALLPFWPKPAPATASTPSLVSLLSRRNELHEQEATPAMHELVASQVITVTEAATHRGVEEPPPQTAAPQTETATTSRLLEAKRRAQRRRDTS